MRENTCNFRNRISITGIVKTRRNNNYKKYYYRYHLYTKYPESKPSPSFYAKTLNQHVWIASFSFSIIFAFTLWLTTKILKAHGLSESKTTLYCCFMSILAGFLNQGSECA